MGFDGCNVRGRKPRHGFLLRSRIGKVQAQLLMAVDRDRLGGLDDLEGQAGSGQAEYRARAAVALRECGAQRQTHQVAVETDGRLEMC